MTAETSRKYELTSFKKNNLLRLRKFMKEVSLDQLARIILDGILFIFLSIKAIADADSDVEGIRRDVVNGRLNSIRSKCIYHPDFARD